MGDKAEAGHMRRRFFKAELKGEERMGVPRWGHGVRRSPALLSDRPACHLRVRVGSETLLGAAFPVSGGRKVTRPQVFLHAHTH